MHCEGILQEQLAVETGLNQGRISLLSNGNARPTKTEIPKLENRFGLPAALLTTKIKKETPEMEDNRFLTPQRHKYLWLLLSARELVRLVESERKTMLPHEIHDAHDGLLQIGVLPAKVALVLLGREEVLPYQRDRLDALFNPHLWRTWVLRDEMNRLKAEVFKLKHKPQYDQTEESREWVRKRITEHDRQIALFQAEYEGLPHDNGHSKAVFKYPDENRLQELGLIQPRTLRSDGRVGLWDLSSKGWEIHEWSEELVPRIHRIVESGGTPSKGLSLTIIENLKRSFA